MSETTNETIAALAARIEALEADRCACNSCNFRRADAEAKRIRARAVEIAALPLDECIAAIEALPSDTAHKVIARLPKLFDLALAVPPALRVRLIEHLDDTARLRLRATLAYRDGQLPTWVAIQGTARVPLKWIPVPQGARAELARAGLKIRDYDGAYQRDEIAGGGVRVYSADEWSARLKFDDQLRAAVDAGWLTATQLDEPQTIHRQLDIWQMAR